MIYLFHRREKSLAVFLYRVKEKKPRMLETLDAIPWSDLQHAYGAANNVPDLIRALASPDYEVYDRALSVLWSNVTHQGTVYSATAYVVPFFCELLEAPTVHNKVRLLHYLTTIAYGASYADVHIREPELREIPEMQQQIAEELRCVQAASDAVSAGYPTYLRLLQSPDPEIRAYAAQTLSRCRSNATAIVPMMQQHLILDEPFLVPASILLSLGLLLPHEAATAQFFQQALRNATDPLIQIAAAIGEAFAMRELTDQAALKVLLQSYELANDTKAHFSKLPFAEGIDCDAYVSSAQRCIGLSVAPFVAPTLIRAVRLSDEWSGLTLVPNLLYFVLGDHKITRDMTVADLSDMQHDALTAIYETEAVWGLGNMWSAVGSFFDPQFPNLGNDSYWDRTDVGAFLSGQNVFRS